MSLNNIAQHSHSHTSIWTDIDNIFPVLYDWLLQGKNFAVVTLVGIEGGSPRPLGAQMLVSDCGASFGYISGGCLKSEIVSKAIEAMNSSQNCKVRYGAGSPYMDITLPCGSGLDLYFDVGISKEIIFKAYKYTMDRKAFTIETNLLTGNSRLSEPKKSNKANTDNQFYREYVPRLRLIIFGTDPAVISLAKLGVGTDMDVIVYSPATDILDSPDTKIFDIRELKHKHQLDISEFDSRTAAVLYFHDHGWELPVITQILESECFYIGAQGSRKTHKIRIDGLLSAGLEEPQVQRVIGPIGSIPHTKSPAELAVSTLAEIITHSRMDTVSLKREQMT